MKPVFISYVRENKEVVDKLYQELKLRGIKAWLDRRDLGPGVRWRRQIRKAIRQGAFFIACFSKEYHEREKTYMNEELTVAIEELRQLHIDRVWFIPVRLDAGEVPDIDIGRGETLRDLQDVKLYEGWNAGIQSILNVIQPEPPESTGSRNTDSKFSRNFTDRDSVSTKGSQSNSIQKGKLTDWVFQQADDLMMRRKIDEALEAYSHGIDLDPHRPVAYKNRGNAYHLKSDYDMATEDYSK